MHPIITEHPAVVAVDEARTKAKADADAEEARLKKAWDDYRDAAALAARSGKPMPPAPERDVGAVMREQFERDKVLGQLRDQAYADHGEEMTAQLRDREAEVLAAAAPLVAQLRDMSAELGDLLGSTKVVRRAQAPGALGPISGLYERSTVDIGVLIHATENGWRFLAEPLAPAPSGRPAGTYNPHDSMVVGRLAQEAR